MAALLSVVSLGAVALLWLDGARAREFAFALVTELCRRREVQLLDGTVALARAGLRWTPKGLKIRRMFRFDFSDEGVGRRTGYLLLRGMTVEKVIFETDVEASRVAATPLDDQKVIPLRRPRR